MSGSGKIREAIKRMSGEIEERILLAEVVSYDAGTETLVIAPIDGTAEISDVRLRPEAEDPGFLLIPEIGSVVVVSMINPSEAVVTMFSKVSSITIRTTPGNVLQLQDGTLGGLPISSNVVSKLNALESDINSLKAAFSAWVVVPSDGGLALKTGLASYFGATLTPTVLANIENTKIIQGA